MSKHRSTRAGVTNEPVNSNFDPATALENLRAEVIDSRRSPAPPRQLLMLCRRRRPLASAC
jgi:hypothetical protein